MKELLWGSAGPRGEGQYRITVGKDGAVEIDEENWCGGSTFTWSRARARQVARMILEATEKKR